MLMLSQLFSLTPRCYALYADIIDYYAVSFIDAAIDIYIRFLC